MVDLVLINGKVWTGDAARPWAESVAVRGGTIFAVGTAAELAGLAASAEKRVDLGGALVLPGFIDSHTHFLAGGFALKSIQLRDAGSREEFAARIAAKARELGPGRWILNGDWDHQQFSPVETAAARLDRRRDAGQSRLRQPLRRPHGRGQQPGPQAGRRDPGYARADPAARSRRTRPRASRPASSRTRPWTSSTRRSPIRPSRRSSKRPRPRSATRPRTASRRSTRWPTRRASRSSRSWPVGDG